MDDPRHVLIADFSEGQRRCSKMCNFLKARGLHVTCLAGLDKAASLTKVVSPDAILIRLKGSSSRRRQRLQLEQLENLCREAGDSVPMFVWADYLTREERQAASRLALREIRLGANYVDFLRMLTSGNP